MFADLTLRSGSSSSGCRRGVRDARSVHRDRCTGIGVLVRRSRDAGDQPVVESLVVALSTFSANTRADLRAAGWPTVGRVAPRPAAPVPRAREECSQ